MSRHHEFKSAHPFPGTTVLVDLSEVSATAPILVRIDEEPYTHRLIDVPGTRVCLYGGESVWVDMRPEEVNQLIRGAE